VKPNLTGDNLSKRIKYLVYILIIVVFDSYGQDPTFSQFYANALYLSPSFAGATQENRLSLNYRNQWPSLPGVFSTYSFSYDRFMPNFSSGIGVLATYDFSLNDNWNVRPGINFKFTYLGLNIAKLIFNNQLLPGGGTTPSVTPPPFNNVADVDFASSLLVYNDRIWAGLTFDHMLRPKQSFYGDESNVKMKLNL
jgi:hypothetical protein